MTGITIQYRWLNADGTVTARTLQRRIVPRIGENVEFDAKERKKEGSVASVTTIVTDNGEMVVVVLK
jgi:hypothetical protein